MRKQLLAAALLLLVLRGVAKTQTPGPTGQAALQKVDVIREGDSVRVEITGSGPLRPKLSILDSPPRVAVSYTHLDVYKRQGKRSAVGSGTGARLHHSGEPTL